MYKDYKKPVIFELGNVADLTAGGKSNRAEMVETSCYTEKGDIVTHCYSQPRA